MITPTEYPCLIPRLKIAYITESVMAMGGSPIAVMILIKKPFPPITILKIVLSAINKTGRNVVKKLLNIPGKSSSFMSFATKVSGGLLVYFFSVFANNGPPTITAGIATHNPYNKVIPRSALYVFTNAVGAGCGGKYPCVTLNAATIGKPIYTTGILYLLDIAMISGTIKTKLTSKNNGMRTMNAVSTSAHIR